MAFPETSQLAAFADFPDGGPPPSGNFISDPFVGAFGGMVVDSGLAVGEASDEGIASWIPIISEFPFEVWATLGTGTGESEFDKASVHLFDDDTAVGYFVTWHTTTFLTLFKHVDGDTSGMWTGSAPASLGQGCGLGLRAVDSTTLQVWAKGSGGFNLVHTEILDDPISTNNQIGFGSYIFD